MFWFLKAKRFLFFAYGYAGLFALLNSISISTSVRRKKSCTKKLLPGSKNVFCCFVFKYLHLPQLVYLIRAGSW